jgi:flagellar motor switch protein FliM
MADDRLSRQEVDALLRGVGDVPEPAAQGAHEPIRSYDIGRQERIVRGGLSALQLINERFADLMRVALFNFTRKSVEVSAGRLRVLKYSEFVRDLAVPSSLNLVQAKPLRGVGLVVLDPDLVAQTIEQLFGGQGRVPTRERGRELTAAEMRIARRLLNAVCEAYAKAWEPVFPLRLEYLRSETNARFATIAAPTELVAASSFSVYAGGGGARFHVCLPYAILEPIRSIIDNPAQAGRGEADEHWTALLSAQLSDVEVELAANLASAAITLRQLMRLETGDVIGIELPEAITAEVDGVPVLECKYGVVHGRYALKVMRTARGGEKD